MDLKRNYEETADGKANDRYKERDNRCLPDETAELSLSSLSSESGDEFKPVGTTSAGSTPLLPKRRKNIFTSPEVVRALDSRKSLWTEMQYLLLQPLKRHLYTIFSIKCGVFNFLRT